MLFRFAVALGVGLLIGAERERRKGEGPSRGPAGIRSFAISSLAGAVAFSVGGQWLLSIVTVGVFALTALAYWQARSDDPGLTSEIALVLTVLLGGLSMQNPPLAAGLGVATTILLAVRLPLHHFVRSVLTRTEVTDVLIFAGATLIVLPLLPNRGLGPYSALNPYKIWIVVILVMGISAIGYMATRWLGPRYGLPITGLASGFISSTATIGAMGARVANSPAVLRPATAGAVLSMLATVIQLGLVLAAISASVLQVTAAPLICAALVAMGYGAVFTMQALQETTSNELPLGHAFSLTTTLFFALTLCVVLVGSAALQARFGERGIMIAAAVAGFVDAHSAAISVATLVSSGRMTPADAVLPILAGFSTNTVSKMILAGSSGGRRFAKRVLPGLIVTVFAAWAGAVLADRISFG
jgi:uncharacterized membrane protein (DUF4010 family)